MYFLTSNGAAMSKQMIIELVSLVFQFLDLLLRILGM